MSAIQPDNCASLFSLSLHRLKRQKPPGERDDSRPSVFKSGRNVWRASHASRVSFLIDADRFFRAFAEAAAQAEKQIFIVGWDTDSRTELPRPPGLQLTEEEKGKGDTVQLGALLSALVRQRPDLQVYVLSWDFAFIYLFEREALPGLKFSTLGSERIRFVLDREHPLCASHHQKIVVIDDKVAFSGGLDLTQRRWDTPEHRAHDNRRVDPGGHSYGPFHDVQICVEGEVARSLGEIVRERWLIATGETVEAPQFDSSQGNSPQIVSPQANSARANSALPDSTATRWPPSAEAVIQDIECAISRTLPMGYRESEDHGLSRPVMEVEKLFLDAIRSARRFIYIENQYFTSPMLAKAIARRLQERDGPEIVMILPRDQTGWIEESTMGLLRSKALKIIEDADRFGRFRCFYPVVPNLGSGYVKVHSKVMVVDDVFVRVGSANMNSRSMGLDTECDISLEAGDRSEVKAAIGRLRRELLGEHLGVDPDEFERRFLVNGSLVQTVESFRSGERTVVEIRPSSVAEWKTKVLPPGEWIDPSGPRGIRRWVAKRIHWARYGLGGGLILLVFLALAILSYLEAEGRLPLALSSIPSPEAMAQNTWAWLRSWDAEKIATRIEAFRGEAWAIPTVLFGFVVGALVFVPITAMIVGVALAYPQGEAITIAIGGAMLAAVAMYGIGRYWAWTKSRTFSKPWIRKLSNQLSRGGIWAVTVVRLTPIAPFAAVGIVAGGLRVPLRDYVIGTVLGLLPGIVTITLLSSGASQLAMSQNWIGLFFALILAGVLAVLLPRWMKRHKRGSAS